MTNLSDDFINESDHRIIDDDTNNHNEQQTQYRGNSADPSFGFVLAIALSIGLNALLPDNADLRYTIAWGALAFVGVLGWLLGSAERIGQERPENVAWGVAFGVMISVPFMIFFLPQFRTASTLIFPEFGIGTVLAYLIFVMPLAETLFFRGAMQRQFDFWVVGLLAGAWNIILFFPVMWSVLLQFVVVAIFLAIALISLNLMYSYVRDRNGLAAAWICQIIASLILFFIPYL